MVDRESDRGVLLDFEQHEPQKTANLSQRFENLIGPPVAFEPTLEFAGKQLSINMATSAAGSIRVEIQQPDGTPIPGFTIAECDEIVGDQIEHTVRWAGRSDLSQLANQAIRLRFVLQDADLYSIQFK